MPDLSGFAILAATVLVIAQFFMKGNLRRHCQTLLLIVCTICVGIFMGQMFKGDGRPAKAEAQVSEERAESALKTMSTINVGLAKASEILGPIQDAAGRKHSAMDLQKSGLKDFYNTAEASLHAALRANPQNSTLKAKLIVLLSVFGKQKELLKSTCNTLRNAGVDSEKQLGEMLWNICVLPKADDGFIQSARSDNFVGYRKAIETALPRGWYQDNAILKLYYSTGQKKEYEAYSKHLEQRYAGSFHLGLTLVLLGGLAAFVGLVVIVIQLGSLARHEKPKVPDESPGLDISMRDVYAVFVGWMTAQLAIGELFKLLPKNMLALGHNPVGIALFSLISYVISMAPALLLIYLVALRPRGLSFVKSMKWRWKTAALGPVKLVFCGFMGWCAIIPMVLLSSSIASAFLGSQGSDNPILPQIALIASSRNVLAILLLGGTVACLAPLCEETIFRGFLYSSMRNRIGIFPAVVVSAFVFGGIHFDKGGALMLMAGVGPVLAVAFERTRSLLPSMVAHGLWNGIAFFVQLALFYS